MAVLISSLLFVDGDDLSGFCTFTLMESELLACCGLQQMPAWRLVTLSTYMSGGIDVEVDRLDFRKYHHSHCSIRCDSFSTS
eukprot:scaffold22953_cov94-Skeletonema_dohrnii-CCMP3373.AAC.1